MIQYYNNFKGNMATCTGAESGERGRESSSSSSSTAPFFFSDFAVRETARAGSLRVTRHCDTPLVPAKIDRKFSLTRGNPCFSGRLRAISRPFRFPPARRGGADSVLRNAFQCSPFLGVKASGGEYCCCVASVVVVYIAYRSHLVSSSSLHRVHVHFCSQIDNATVTPAWICLGCYEQLA